MKNILLISLFLVATITGCSDMRSKKRSTGTISLLSVPNNKVVAIISKHQLLPNFQRCLNKLPASAVSSTTKTELKNALTSLASEGESEEISAPMLMTMTKIVSEICNDLITFENTLTKRKYFTDFNLDNTDSAANNTLNSDKLQGSARTLASSCWGRDATTDELDIILKALEKTSMNGKVNRSSALFLCTSLLSTSAATKF